MVTLGNRVGCTFTSGHRPFTLSSAYFYIVEMFALAMHAHTGNALKNDSLANPSYLNYLICNSLLVLVQPFPHSPPVLSRSPPGPSAEWRTQLRVWMSECEWKCWESMMDMSLGFCRTGPGLLGLATCVWLPGSTVQGCCSGWSSCFHY